MDIVDMIIAQIKHITKEELMDCIEKSELLRTSDSAYDIVWWKTEDMNILDYSIDVLAQGLYECDGFYYFIVT